MANLLTRTQRPEMASMFDVFDRLMGDSWGQFPTGSTSMALPIDVYERDNVLFVKAAIPGVKPEEVELSIEEGILTISGETKQTEETTDEKTKFFRREYRYGKFARSIRLPDNIDLDKVDAKFENGFVTVTLPRTTPIKPEVKRIPIKGAEKVLTSG